MYHSVSPADYRGRRPAGYWLAPEEFSSQLDFLVREGFSTVTLREMLGVRDGLLDLPERPVVLTFDDGYLDNYLYARPLLRDRGLHACYFLTVSTLGAEGMMSPEQARSLIEEGDEIGSHGFRHDLLAGKDRVRLLADLSASRLVLSRKLGAEIRFFSLPRGYRPPGLGGLARRAGYRAMCTSRPGYNSPRADPFGWKRFPVRTGWKIERFRAVVARRGRELAKVLLEENIRNMLRWRHRFKV